MHLATQRLLDTSVNPPARSRVIWPLLLLVAILFVISPGMTNSAHSGEAYLTWDPPTTNTDGTPLTDLAGYKVYYGTASGNYDTIVDAGNATSYTVTSLISDVTYYFATTAYDTSANESGFSNEVSKTIEVVSDTTAPTGTISINSGASYSTSTSVTLNLSCSDAGSGCSQMRLSNNGTTWDAWENYATSKTWTLPATDGVRTVYIQYRDTNSNTSQNYTDTITLDTTTPVISGIGTSNLTPSGITLSWTTGEGANTQVDFGTTTSYGSSSALDASMVTSHSVVLSSLSSSTLYHYRVKSRDAAGNLTTSRDYTFTTTGVPDSTAPVISDISTGNITSSDAIITWTTDEASTSRIEYGTSINYGLFSSPDNTLAASHTVTLSGLTQNTAYYFRVLSSDQSGNQAVSAGSSFTTLFDSQQVTPAAIDDLTVRAGASSRSSVVLDWTATGADGVEGTASAYDLRMSSQKIIEDGITPALGEINFSMAVRINSMPSPAVAGTPESVQAGLLDTNSVYYFAIKAIDNYGNASTISNVINGNPIPPVPVTAVREGYTMISIPLVPATSDVQTLFTEIVGAPVELYWWSSDGLGENNGVFVAETNVVPGYGYFLKSNTDNAVLNITGTAVTDPSRVIPLQPGWNIIGNPYTGEVALRNTYIRNTDTGDLKSYEDAVIAGWVGNSIYNYNGSTYDFSMYTDATLSLWQGYWVAVLQNTQFEIIIYKP